MSMAPLDRFYRHEPLALVVWHYDDEAKTNRVLTLRWTYDLETPGGRVDDWSLHVDVWIGDVEAWQFHKNLLATLEDFAEGSSREGSLTEVEAALRIHGYEQDQERYPL